MKTIKLLEFITGDGCDDSSSGTASRSVTAEEATAAGNAHAKRELKKARLSIKSLEAKVKSLEKELESLVNRKKCGSTDANGDNSQRQIRLLEDKVGSIEFINSTIYWFRNMYVRMYVCKFVHKRGKMSFGKFTTTRV